MLNAQNQPLTTQRFKPQVSTVFGSMSILIDADCVRTKNFWRITVAQAMTSSNEGHGYRQSLVVAEYACPIIWVTPGARDCLIIRTIEKRCLSEIAYNPFGTLAGKKIEQTNHLPSAAP